MTKQQQGSAECLFRTGKARIYINQFRQAIETGLKVNVQLYCRVSGRPQMVDGNLDDQMDEAMKRLASLGFRLGGNVRICEGVESNHIDAHRPILERAIKSAKWRNAVLVADSRDRFLRSGWFCGTNETELPTEWEYQELLRMAGRVPLATLQHPDEPARGHQIKRGQSASANRGGRPRKMKSWAQRREAYLPLAVEMRKQGMTCRAIAAALNAMDDGFPDVCPKTVWNWLRSLV